MKYKITYESNRGVFDLEGKPRPPEEEIVEAHNVLTGQGGAVEFWDAGGQTLLILSCVAFEKIELIKEDAEEDAYESIKLGVEEAVAKE